MLLLQFSLYGPGGRLDRKYIQMSTFDLRRVRPTDDVIFQTVRDEAVLLNLKSQQYYGLDAVGSRMWGLLVDLGDLSSVAAALEPETQRAAVPGIAPVVDEQISIAQRANPGQLAQLLGRAGDHGADLPDRRRRLRDCQRRGKGQERETCDRRSAAESGHLRWRPG